MLKGASGQSGRTRPWPKTPLGWLVFCGLAVPIAPLLAIAVINLIGSDYLWYLASRGTTFDAWGLLSIVSALMSLVAIVGAGFALWRRRMVMALAFAALALPMPLIVGANRCDVLPCPTWNQFLALPASAFNWSARFRPVTDANEASEIASDALSEAGSDDSPFRKKRFGDHWIVSTIDEDGRPGARAVRIDTRTGEATFIPCPKDKVQCGMEIPTVSDGRRVYRNDAAGLAAVFPAGLAVCTARGDDDEPRGFSAIAYAPDLVCEVLDGSPPMGVEVARYRLNGCTVTEAPDLPWRPLSPETAKRFTQAPKLAGRPSLACELHDAGQIQISVYASARSGSRDVLYEGYIVTTPPRLAEDVRRFETFLEGVTLGSATPH